MNCRREECEGEKGRITIQQEYTTNNLDWAGLEKNLAGGSGPDFLFLCLQGLHGFLVVGTRDGLKS